MKKSRLIILIAIVIVIAGGVSALLLRPKPSPHEFAIAAKQNIIQEVSVTGKVKPYG